MPRPDRHNEIEINLLRSGSLTYLLGGRRTTIAVGRVAAFWAAIPHQIVEFDCEGPYFVVTVPLSMFLAAGLEVSVVNRILEGELVVDADPDPCDDLKFQQWERDPAVAQTDDARVELVGKVEHLQIDAKELDEREE